MGKMRQFRRGLRSCVGQPLAYQLRDGYGATIAGLLERVIRGERVHDAEIKDMLAYDDDEGGSKPQRIGLTAGPALVKPEKGKAIAIVPVHGVAMYNIEYQPLAFSTLLLSQRVNALANNPEVGTILLDINSPGGMVTGTPEAAEAIYQARKRKKVVALVQPLAASAAYWIASQAEEIISIPSGDIGSIGVFTTHVDCSKFMEDMGVKPTFIYAGENKVERSPFSPLSASAQKFIQGEVDTIHRDFLKAVARGRGTNIANVEENFGQGRTFMAPVALKVGMIDAIAPVDQALAHWGVPVVGGSGARRAGEIELDAIDISDETDGQQESARVEEREQAATQEQTAETVEETAEGSAGETGEENAEPGSLAEVFQNVVSTDGCESLEFETRHGAIYSSKQWPVRIQVSAEFIAGGSTETFTVNENSDVTFRLSNGWANYRFLGMSADNHFVFELGENEYAPPPSEEDEQAQKDQAERKRMAEVRRRRLALLTSA